MILFSFWIIQAAGPIPDTVGKWFGLILQSFAIASAVGGAIWYIVGGKITANKDAITALQATTADLKEKVQYSEFDRARLHEDLGKLTSSIANMTSSAERREERREQREDARDERREGLERGILERLTKMESKSDFATAIEKLCNTIASR